ncbi:MAG: rhodanese-related sulfurtransferase [Rhizobiaceae bacterium]|nr:rhodanese-related sulfurtransferase [Rhizobiaceae bacterium]
MSNETQGMKVAALYLFTRLSDPAALRQPLATFCCARGIKGTLLLAGEGINGTVAGTARAIDELLAYLKAMPEFAGLEAKFSDASEMPFHRMKVRLKKEIVTMGVPGLDPTDAGTYVAPADWNALISDPETMVIDTRNAYEVALGTFRNAVDPGTASFTEFPAWVDRHHNALAGRKVAMFCTGGIRCEKATAYLKSVGLPNVYHLKGGILKYLEEVPETQSLWDGECFVFDERVSVGHGLEVGDAELCRACRHPLTAQERSSPHYVEGVSCPHCAEQRSEADRARYAERHRQVELAGRRGRKHIGS